MKVTIQSVHFDADKKLIQFIEEKIGKLGTFFSDIIGAEVTLKLEKSVGLDDKAAEVRLIVPGNDLFAKKTCKTFEEAIDTTVAALKNQIIKHKEKLRRV
jgi:putative sigma-54 modulation protein